MMKPIAFPMSRSVQGTCAFAERSTGRAATALPHMGQKLRPRRGTPDRRTGSDVGGGGSRLSSGASATGRRRSLKFVHESSVRERRC